jgi:hypothetical protein
MSHDHAETKPPCDQTSLPDQLDSFGGGWYDLNHNSFFTRYLFLTIVMIIWPWIFFGVVWGAGGIQLHNSHAANNPKDTLYFVTAISNIIGMMSAYLFSKAVASLAQKRVVHKSMAISDVSFFTALKNRVPSFSLFRRGRRHLLVMVILYLIIFALITPGLTALLTPIHFNQKVQLFGTELDFASNHSDCIDWFHNYSIPTTCDWETYNGLRYTNCLAENQLVDVLESGRSNMLSLLSEADVSVTYIQLGTKGGLRFVGPLNGLLPNGPNGVPAFNTLDARSLSFFPDANTTDPRHSSYNYTLELQGISNNVTCIYDTTSPVIATNTTTGLMQYNGSCPPNQDFLLNSTFLEQTSPHSLGFWACRTAPSANSYYLYLQGNSNYQRTIGNMTCTVSPILPTVFPLTYTGQSGTFYAQSQNSSSPVSFTTLGDEMMMSIGSIVWEAQSSVSNLLAEAITTLGVKSFSLSSDAQQFEYLPLYEAMIKGILDYEATYIRLLYSARADRPPQSCLRTVNGIAYLDVFGWTSTGHTGAYLIPIMLVNLTTLIILVVAMCTGDSGTNTRLLPRFDPTDPESLILSHDPSGRHLLTATAQPTNPSPWGALVGFGRNKEGIYRLWPKDEIVSK